MSVEYLATKEEAHAKLAADCTQKLQSLLEHRQGEAFSFLDHWGQRKQDSSTHPQIPVLNQFSRVFLNFHQPTFVRYDYSIGTITATLYQVINRERRVVQQYDDVDPKNIPFDKFSEDDLLAATRKIDRHVKLSRPRKY